MLVQRVRVNGQLDPEAAAGDALPQGRVMFIHSIERGAVRFGGEVQPACGAAAGVAETWLARLLKGLGLDAANTIVQFGPRPTSEL